MFDTEKHRSEGLEALYRAAIASLDPGFLVCHHLEAATLGCNAISVLALGKAAVGMAMGAREALGAQIVEEVVVAPVIPEGAPAGWMASEHPVPSLRSVCAARALLLAATRAEGRVLALISGGGSSLASLPAVGLSLRDKVTLVEKVARSGADIHRLNIVRKHLSRIKGGQLAAAAHVPIFTLILSDVVGDIPSSVASGPTLADSSTFAQALQIAGSCGADSRSLAMLHLQAGVAAKRDETPKDHRPGDSCHLLAGSATLATRAVRCAVDRGLAVSRFPHPLVGRVESVAGEILRTASGPGIWIGGGEATIALPNAVGRGGRAQHLALLLAKGISGRSGVSILVAGSDGTDGNSGAAGAVVNGKSWHEMLRIGRDPEIALQTFDSATVLATINAQVITGPTGVNHADLVMVEICR